MAMLRQQRHSFRVADHPLTGLLGLADHLLEFAARLSRDTGLPCTQTVTMLSYASTLSSGDFFSRTRFAIFPGSIVPSCESSLNSRALLMVAALKIWARDSPAF